MLQGQLPLSSSNNVGILRSAPGSQVFANFVGASSYLSHFAASVVTDDEADQFDTDHDSDDDTLSGDTTSLEGGDEGVVSNTNDTPDSPMQCPKVIPFDLDHNNPRTNLTNQDNATSSLDAPSELMWWHCRLGHLPFANIRLMASRGEIPKRLATCRIPKCQSCLYGRATKRPWRTKGHMNKIKTVTRPGQCVPVDQLKSLVPGLVGQNKGYFFRKRYMVATIFVDHFSHLSFVYLQESIKGEETLLAKRAF